jgi:ribonuclease HI
MIGGFKMKVQIYADGATRGNGKAKNIGGYGVFLKNETHEKEINEGFRNTTNNKMELMAVITGLKAMKKTNVIVEVYSDSAYVVNCINQKWYMKWLNNGWVTSAKTSVENRDLWIQLLDLIATFPFITFIKVKGHADCEGNIRADKLANKAMDELEKKNDSAAC